MQHVETQTSNVQQIWTNNVRHGNSSDSVRIQILALLIFFGIHFITALGVCFMLCSVMWGKKYARRKRQKLAQPAPVGSSP
jgi:hypothetical protein